MFGCIVVDGGMARSCVYIHFLMRFLVILLLRTCVLWRWSRVVSISLSSLLVVCSSLSNIYLNILLNLGVHTGCIGIHAIHLAHCVW